MACGGSGASTSASTDPGPLVDNTKWRPTDDGAELFGPRPPDAVCILEPINCDEYYPWPEDECVTFDATSTCVTAYVPECWPPFTVLAVYTRMPNLRDPLCNWITFEQPSLRPIRTGDVVQIRARHAALTAPVSGQARIMFAVGDELALEYEVLIPSDSKFATVEWTAPRDFPEGTQLLFHVDNHGQNEYMLIEARVLEPGENTEL